MLAGAPPRREASDMAGDAARPPRRREGSAHVPPGTDGPPAARGARGRPGSFPTVNAYGFSVPDATETVPQVPEVGAVQVISRP